MKITKVRTIVIYGPRRKAYGRTYASGLGPRTYSEHCIVLIDTDAEITGIGEVASCFARRGRIYEAEIEQLLAPVLIGEDPYRIAHLAARMNAVFEGSEPAKAGLEMALFDIVGKDLGTPVYNLLGGMVRERVGLSYSIPYGGPGEMAAFAAEKARAGFRTVKVKVGQDRKTDIEAVRLIREAVGPDVIVRVDANMRWRTVAEAMQVIQAIQPYDIELVEQPLPPRELDALAELRRRVSIPIMADESVWTPRDALEVVRRGAVDIVNVYLMESGGFLAAARNFGICETAGIPCIIGSMPEMGLATAAQIHLGVAMTNLGLDSDCCGVLYHEEDLLTRPLKIEGGFSYPPVGPGLGVELDMKVVERWKKPPA
ncbi:MAG: hypothetical protein EXQ86_05870 [Rhodospirillales bacterium]|nr:hypothetical protein [Rhodospirillales bacterium]